MLLYKLKTLGLDAILIVAMFAPLVMFVISGVEALLGRYDIAQYLILVAIFMCLPPRKVEP